MRILAQIPLLVLLIALSPVAPAGAGSLDTASDAYSHGDYGTALKILRPLARLGETEAQFNLGVMYAQGLGVQRNAREAVKWWHMAAEQNLASAQVNLGLMYAGGRGVQQSNVLAYMWWNLAAMSDDEFARTNRDKVSRQMTLADIGKARRMTDEWMIRHAK